jgi:signal transduction histidine kinase
MNLSEQSTQNRSHIGASAVVKQRILVVDDATEVASEIVGLLWTQYEMEAVSSAAAALLRAGRWPWLDLILLDVRMADGDGFEVCKAIKHTPGLQDIPIIFLTSLSDPRDEAYGLKLGAADFISKPVNPSVLRARVDTQLRLRAATQELERKNARMRDEVERTTQEITAKTQALMAASHDLRQPVHALGLMLDSLMRSPQAAALEPSWTPIRMVVQSLSDSLNVLLSAARLEAGLIRAELRTICLSDVLEQCRSDYEHAASWAGIDLALITQRVFARADAVLVRGIVQNLLSNALRCSEGKHVRIEVSADAGMVQVSVSDDGKGMPESKLANIFQAGRAIEPCDELRGGTGIGLSLAKQYADLLGTELVIASRLGNGTRARFFLPLEPTPQPQTVVHPAGAGEWLAGADKGANVLLFDDDPIVRDATASTLLQWGCSVDAQADWVAWMACAVPGTPAPQGVDLVIADFHMGGDFNGLDLIARARQWYGVADLPGLLLTGDVNPELEKRAGAMQVMLLHKPLRPSALYAAIAQLVQESRKK